MERIFNREQEEVIRAFGGYHLVLAPPGCGKTAVLAERIVYAHKEHGVPFSEMACLTFTNRAARGMRERIEQRLGDVDGLDELFVGNVHRFCSHFLFDKGVVPEQAAIIDTETSISIIADILGEDELKVLAENSQRQRYSQIINLQHLLYQCEKGYPKSLIVHRDALPSQALRELCLTFGLEYTQQSTIELYQHADSYLDRPVSLSRDAQQLMQMLYAAQQYARYKQRGDLLDFEDLLLFTHEALTAVPYDAALPHPTERQALSHPTGQLRWLQVDEVQDLNPLQLAIIDAFTAPDATVVYLGDAQQAIFSFMGAKTDTLTMLYERCGEAHFHNFFMNYRSPQYLLDVFNTYGERQLGIRRDLLPKTVNTTPRQSGDLLLMDAPTSIDELNMVARKVRALYEQHPDETVAVVVAFNSDADEVSAALGTLPHFKVSGSDVFTTPMMRTLLAHLSIVAMEHNFIAWSQLLTGLRIYSTNSGARQFMRGMMELALTPTDFLCYSGQRFQALQNPPQTYLMEFVQEYEQHDIVVFDTETTGLNVFEDDVVQLAAVKVRRGRIVDELNLFIETDRPLPAMLGDVVNPLIEEYRHHPHLQHAEALQRFTDFAKDCVILGHNTTYDYQIMEHNMRRYAPHLSLLASHPQYLDTLKLARLLHPRQPSYKLKNLLQQLHLEGENSHLASDDILATHSLMVYCYDRARSIVGRQLEFISRHRKTIDRFRHVYADLYHHAHERLYQQADNGASPVSVASGGSPAGTIPPLLAKELDYAYDQLKQLARMEPLPKLPYIIKYIEKDLLTPASGRSLAEQLAHHIQDLCTMREADLCGASSMTERVFISTVHKAKGLEFDNVIVYDAVDGKYPSIYANTRDGGAEEARKFYVAISRARRRLIISVCHQTITRWGRTYLRQPSPYITPIGLLFEVGV